MSFENQAETWAKELRNFGGLELTARDMTATDAAAVFAFEWLVYAYCVRHELPNPASEPAPRPAADRLMAWVLARRDELERAVRDRDELAAPDAYAVSVEDRAARAGEFWAWVREEEALDAMGAGGGR